MALSKQDMRKVMYSLSDTDVSDDKAHKFIKNLADYQNYKSAKSFLQCITNLRIFYTSAHSKRLIMRGMTVDEACAWEDEFINKEQSAL